jgi:hypothetical protein
VTLDNVIPLGGATAPVPPPGGSGDYDDHEREAARQAERSQDLARADQSAQAAR